jgi:hypothetical protein
VQLPSGGKLTLAAEQVEEHVALRPDEEQYQKMLHSYADTVADQWKLAEWCREHKLFAQRDTHLERIIALDPNHSEARRLLGYSMVDGRWARQDEVMQERGYVRYKGRWRTQQEIDLMEKKRKQELDEKEWFKKLDTWRSWLPGDRHETARESILAIDDPMAIKALMHGLKNDGNSDVRVLYAEVLAKFHTADTIKALANAALEDEESEVRISCLEQLRKRPNPDAVNYFCQQLKSKDNSRVNRAGAALGQMNDLSAVGPLIDALVTAHKFKINANQNQYNVGFGSGSGGGFTAGNSTRIISKNLSNQDVLDALVVLTKQNFNFDQLAWKYWLASQKKAEHAAK